MKFILVASYVPNTFALLLLEYRAHFDRKPTRTLQTTQA